MSPSPYNMLPDTPANRLNEAPWYSKVRKTFRTQIVGNEAGKFEMRTGKADTDDPRLRLNTDYLLPAYQAAENIYTGYKKASTYIEPARKYVRKASKWGNWLLGGGFEDDKDEL